MALFNKKGIIELYSEPQKDEMIDRLEKAHIDYEVRERRGSEPFTEKVTYIVRVNTADLKKAV